MTLGIGFALAAFAKNAGGIADDSATSKLTIQPIFEDRERFERRTNKNYSNAIADNKSDLFTRARAGFAFKDENITGKFVYQYSHDLSWYYEGNKSTDNSELLLGYVEIPNGDGKVTVGRQRLDIGNQRILGESDWDNVSTSWDQVRFTNAATDVFAASLGAALRSSRDARVLGVTQTGKFGTSLLMFQHDNQMGTRYDLYTLDQLYTPQYAGLNWIFEGSIETGSQGTKAVDAFAGMVKASRNIGSKLTASIEGDIASGGGNAGRSNSFTTYYSSNHNFQGIADIQGFSNLKEYAASLSYKVSPKLSAAFTYQHFSLYDATGGWISKSDTINTSGATSLIDATGGKGSDVGQELDFETKFALRKDTNLQVGIADFIPGSYLKSFTGSAFSKESYWFYSQLSFKF